jgi:hypothetical protein
MPVKADDGSRDALAEEEVNHAELLPDRHLRRARTAVRICGLPEGEAHDGDESRAEAHNGCNGWLSGCWLRVLPGTWKVTVSSASLDAASPGWFTSIHDISWRRRALK